MVAAWADLHWRRGARDVADRRGWYQYRSPGCSCRRQPVGRAFESRHADQRPPAGSTGAARFSGADDTENSTHHAEPDYRPGFAKHARAEAAFAVQAVRRVSAVATNSRSPAGAWNTAGTRANLRYWSGRVKFNCAASFNRRRAPGYRQ